MRWVKIQAMSKTLKDVKRDLGDGRSAKFAEHCCKIIVTHGKVYFEHWCNELYGFCSWIMTTTIKPNNRNIDKQLIDEYFFNSCCDTLDTFKTCLKLQNMNENKDDNWNESNDELLFTAYRTFCSEVSNLLTNKSLNQYNLRDLAKELLVDLIK